ncbi:MAG: hypothetical protein IJ758_03510 [Clostridia bacterium]|nr:hypothetical protein [Clostridia bacterium]
MQIMLMVAIGLLLAIIYYQQKSIDKFEDEYFEALKKTCEILGLIEKNLTVEEILQLEERG